MFGRDGVWLPTAAEAAAFDRDAHGTAPERVLMENAGRAAALVFQRLHPRGRILGFAGSGHNGGDLLVMLRTLRTWGRDVTVLTVGAREPDLSLVHGFDIDTYRFTDFPRDITADVLVDGMLGTGSEGAPRADVAAAIKVMNATSRHIVSLDMPSGINATTGAVKGEVVHAASTITFGWPKLGLLLFPAREYCGRLIAVEIGFPPVQDGVFGAEAITPDWAAARAPRRPPNAHKGMSGTLLILAGHTGMAGAAVLAGGAAVRTGAGVVRIASDTANRTIIQLALPESIFVDRNGITAEQVQKATAIVAGPGIGRTDDARAALDVILKHAHNIPTLLDADALNMLSEEPATLKRAAKNRPLLITPHPKELSRLTGASVDDISADRVRAATDAAKKFGCVVLLKGTPSLVASPDEHMLVNTIMSSDVAVAGMGDQLAGVVGGLMAAGAPVRTAAGTGLFYGGRAARIAQRGRSLTPTDVSDHMSAAFADPGPEESTLRLPFVTFDQPAAS